MQPGHYLVKGPISLNAMFIRSSDRASGRSMAAYQQSMPLARLYRYTWRYRDSRTSNACPRRSPAWVACGCPDAKPESLKRHEYHSTPVKPLPLCRPARRRIHPHGHGAHLRHVWRHWHAGRAVAGYKPSTIRHPAPAGTAPCPPPHTQRKRILTRAGKRAPNPNSTTRATPSARWPGRPPHPQALRPPSLSQVPRMRHLCPRLCQGVV
jgi:hypothetical protein